MIIRRATLDDIDEIVPGARAFAKQAQVEHLIADDIKEPLAGLMALPSVRVYLAETDKIVGGIGVSVLPFMWNHSLIEMSELFFWVYPGAPPTAALALLRRILADVEEELIDLVTLASLPTSPAGVNRVYKKLGFVKIQEMFQKEFTSWR